MIQVELIRAWPQRREVITVKLADGASVGDALESAGWRVDGEFAGVAVFGQTVSTQTLLQAGDRIELLRRLELDPKQARLKRADKRNRKP